MRLTGIVLLSALLAATLQTAHAEEWKSIASDQGVKLEAQTIGNLARLRFTNTGKAAVQVNWKVETALTTKQKFDRQGELNLDSGESVVVANGPYRDASGPQAIQSVQGKMTVTPATK